MNKIGKYTIQGELGKGAMGIVYRAEDPYIGRPVAVKTIRFDGLTQESDREHAQKRFMREARSAGNLSHPNIVTIYEVGEDEELTYIAMEYIEGESLEELLEKGKTFSIDEVIDLTRQLGEALDYAHKKGIIHRDIKPGNILIDVEGKPHIVDFGIARISSSTMTQTSMVMGTPYYMAPEQLAGKKIDQRADVFALGAVVYEMLTGTKPFPGETITTVIYKIINEDPLPVRDIRQDLSPGLDYIIRKALIKNPDQRYTSCGSMADDLQEYPRFVGASLPGAEPEPEEIQVGQDEETQHVEYFKDSDAVPKSGALREKKPVLFVLGAMMAVIIIVLGTVLILQNTGADRETSRQDQPRASSTAARTQSSQTVPGSEETGTGSTLPLSDRINALLAEGQEFYLEQDLKNARTKFEDILRLDSDNHEARLFLAEILRQTGQTDKALSEFQSLLSSNENDARIYLILGEIHEKKGDDLQALENFQQAFQIGFGEGDSRNQYASRRVQEIQERMAVSGGEDPTSKEASLPGTADESASRIKTVIMSQVEKDYSEGENAYNRGEYKETVAMMENVLREDPAHTEARRLLDAAKAKIQELEQEQLTQRTLANARQALNRNDHAEAMRRAKDVLNREPGHPEAEKIYNLAFEGATKKDIQSLISAFEKIYDPVIFHDFYKDNCVYNEYNKWKDFLRSIPNLYSSISTKIISPTVYSLKKERGRYTSAGLRFSQITTAVHKAKGTKQVLMEGTYFWELIKVENNWKITSIVYKPSR